jgi:hypothetical protein
MIPSLEKLTRYGKAGGRRAVKISYSILTTPRQEPYLKDTLRSLDETGFFDKPEHFPLRLICGSLDSSHVEEYRNDSRFHIDRMSEVEAEQKMFSIAGVALRCTWGHHRALHYDKANPDCDAVLVMEDDLKFARGWLKHMQSAVQEIISLYGRRWLLTLYVPQFKEPLEAYRAGKKWISRGYAGFYGAQAILYPLGVRDSYMAYLTGHPVNLPHDLALPEVMKALGIPMFTTAPCLVQHTGKIKQGVSSGFHISESFLDQV